MTSTMTGFSNWRAYPTDSRDGFLMMSVSRFWSYENRSSTRHSEASHSWIQRHVHLLTDSFPLMSNSSVRASCWRAQPVTNIDSPISNPTRVGFSGISVVSSTSYSTATSSVHALRCFCKRSSSLSYLIPHQASRPTSSGST